MERIYKIQAAFETSFDSFTEYRMTKAWPNRKEQPVRDVKDLIQIANVYLRERQMVIIERAAKELNDQVFRSEVKRIERYFSLDGYTKEYPKTNTKTKMREGSYVEHYNYERLLSDLENGEISESVTRGGLDFAAQLYAETLLYDWLLANMELEVLPVPKRLVWNGQKNALADIFYQLKTMVTEKGQPLLDASNEVLAQFLKGNFECFKNTSLGAIQNYFEMPEKRTSKKSKDKITLTRGGE